MAHIGTAIKLKKKTVVSCGSITNKWNFLNFIFHGNDAMQKLSNLRQILFRLD
jgi:hypothetical protein